MTEPDTPTPLHLHTLDSLCDELVSGRGVTTADGTVFRLDSDEARAAFQWYLDHQSEWAKNVRTADLEPRADAILVPPAVLPPATAPEPATRKPILHIQSLSTRRFGGIQRYDSDDFKHHFESPLTLIEGLNGSGKTSLLSAITWCLTGHCLRSQRPPEPVDGSKTVPVRSEAEFAEAPPFSEDILAITPLPPAGVVRALGDAPLPVDTRVTLRFADADGQPAGAMTRAVTRTPRGKVQTEVTRSPGLDLDPVATEIGTIMAGALPTLDLAKASDLGAAVASLTGLRPLQDLARHAARSETKYRKDLVQAREREIAELDQTYAASWSELANLLDEHAHLAPQTAAPPEPTALGAEDILARCTAEFDEMESAAFAASRAILGDSFNPADRAARDDIKDNVGPARGQTSNESLARLDSAQRLRCLAALTADDLATAADLVQRLTVEAGELAELARNEGLHARLRLYARVADWLQESADGPDGHLDQCPVCLTALAGKTDPVSGEPVAKHIESLLRSDGEYLQQSLAAWERRAGERLAAALPPALQAELTRNLPERPTDLIEAALCEELFASPVFGGSLAPLKERARRLWSAAEQALPPFAEPDAPALPDCFQGALSLSLVRLTRAVAFARWRTEHASACGAAFQAVIGGAADATGIVESTPIRQLLARLEQLAHGALPLTEARLKLDRLAIAVGARRQKEGRIALYARAEAAIRDLVRLGVLVEQQVGALTGRLSEATLRWKGRLYRSANVSAPAVVSTAVSADGRLQITAEADGTRGDASHVSNASDLRATLLAFLIAFWEHLLEERGGLALLLIDDVQELFDPENRRHVAACIPDVAAIGQVIVTTNDGIFARAVAEHAEQKLGVDGFVHLEIASPTSEHACIRLAPKAGDASS